MADWKRLSDGTWGVQTRSGRAGQTVRVTRADGSASNVTLGALVKRTRWGTVFTVAGKAVPSTRPTRTARRRPARRRSRAPRGFAPDLVQGLRTAVAVSRPAVAVVAPVVAEPVDPSVLRFLLLDLGDESTEGTPEGPDMGPGRIPMID